MTDLHDCDHIDEAARQWVEECGPDEPEVPGAADEAEGGGE